MTADLVARLEIAAKIHDDMTGKGNAMAATIREAASALRSSGEADDTVTILGNVVFHDDWFARFMVEGVMFLAPLEAKDKAQLILAAKKRRKVPATPASAWRPIAEGLPAGRYLVTDGESVGIARRRPKLGLWVFPSAQQAFKPTHYQPLPAPPTSTKGG